MKRTAFVVLGVLLISGSVVQMAAASEHHHYRSSKGYFGRDISKIRGSYNQVGRDSVEPRSRDRFDPAAPPREGPMFNPPGTAAASEHHHYRSSKAYFGSKIRGSYNQVGRDSVEPRSRDHFDPAAPPREGPMFKPPGMAAASEHHHSRTSKAYFGRDISKIRGSYNQVGRDSVEPRSRDRFDPAAPRREDPMFNPPGG